VDATPGGLLFGLAPAAALAREWVRGRRRRQAANRALHELRRPLQALALLDDESGAVPATGPRGGRRGLIELARWAAEDLDHALNGVPTRREARRVSCRELVLAALERWRRPLEERGTAIRVFWDAGPALLVGDPARLSQALDNLIANVLEHGGTPLVVTGSVVAGRLRVTLADGGQRLEGNGLRGSRAGDVESGGHRRDPRHGHGTRIVGEVAAAHGGRFALHRSSAGAVAALELPLSDPHGRRAT
jgi:signal transduction histidine kinase